MLLKYHVKISRGKKMVVFFTSTKRGILQVSLWRLVFRGRYNLNVFKVL